MSLLDDLEGNIDYEDAAPLGTSLLDELEGDIYSDEGDLEGVSRSVPLIWQNTNSEALELLGEDGRRNAIKAQATAVTSGMPLEDAFVMQPHIDRELEEIGYAKTVALQATATFGSVLPKAVGNLFKLGGAVYEEWDSVVGKTLDYVGVPEEYRGVVAESLGRTIGSTGDKLYEIGRGVEEYWQPRVSGAKKYVAQAVDTLTTMLIGASTGYTLPALAGVSGLEKAAGSLREGFSLPRALAAGGVSGMVEYGSEFMPLKILGKPGLSFIKRLSQGLLYDVPGELAATLGDMKLVDETMLGKSYPLGAYAQALLDTIIVSSLVTGIGTSASHPFVNGETTGSASLDTAIDGIRDEEIHKRTVPAEGTVTDKPAGDVVAIDDGGGDLYIVHPDKIDAFLDSLISGEEVLPEMDVPVDGDIVTPVDLLRENDGINETFRGVLASAKDSYSVADDLPPISKRAYLEELLYRAISIREAREQYALPKADWDGLVGFNPVEMSRDDFDERMHMVRQQASEKATGQAKRNILNRIEEMRLRNTGNLRRAMALPSLEKMSLEQAREFYSVLGKYRPKDVFLQEKTLKAMAKMNFFDIRTIREAQEAMAKEAGVPLEEVSRITVSEWDKFKYDVALMRKNPFFRLLVTDVTRVLGGANIKAYATERDAIRLARASEKSRKKSVAMKVLNAFIPQDKDLIRYLESPVAEKEAMARLLSEEQLDYAHYIQSYFNAAEEYLLTTGAMEKGRERYFVHIRQGILENIKEKGLLDAVKNLFADHEQLVDLFSMDSSGELATSKAFPFAKPREGGVEPTYNVTEAFMTYVRLFEKKVALDSLLLKFDVYTQAVAHHDLSPQGAAMEENVRKFVYEYLNNKKGQRVDQFFGKQGGTVDMGMRALRAFTTFLDIGFVLPIGVPAFLSEQSANIAQHGMASVARGSKRALTKKGRAIAEKYASFVGRSTWEQLVSPEHSVGDKFYDLAFSMLHESSRIANIQSLLGNMTETEFESETLSDERLAEITLEAGRFRVVSGMKSLKGSTSFGGLLMQYKTWALPPLMTAVSDLHTLGSDIINRPLNEALTTKEANELYRIVALTVPIIVTGSILAGADADNERSLAGRMKRRIYTDSLPFLYAMMPTTWLTVRGVSFIFKFIDNLIKIITVETYKRKEGFVGVDRMIKQFTPGGIRQFESVEDRK